MPRKFMPTVSSYLVTLLYVLGAALSPLLSTHVQKEILDCELP